MNSMTNTGTSLNPGDDDRREETRPDDRLYLDLRGALERLCRAQTHMPAWWRAAAQDAIVIVQMIGSAVCPDAWSKHDQPEYPEATS